jgi:hypothetical protein
MSNIRIESSEDNCSKCARYEKQIARLKKGFIQADDENVLRLMRYENKILELKAAIKRSKADHSSEKSKQVTGVREVAGPVSNTQDRHLG